MKSCILVLPVLLVLTLSDGFDHDIYSKFSSENINLQNMHVMYSYEDVFEKYYNIASSAIEEAGFTVPFTIEEFQEGFQSHDYDISVYTDYVIEQTVEGRALFSSADENAGIMLTRVFNNTGFEVDVSYNRMMCFADDAKSWTGLNHLHSVTLSDGAHHEMKISQNLLATTIVFGYEDLATESRYITYANQLSKLNYTDMTTYYVTLGLER